ncbi:transmembrane prediction [Stieleria sp. ICT_E10.1]|uniref:transmembrane prediction n=1 Tax=Stieleria sedimenti TaxID=2976331 RepID=UPI0021805803|nr:transmembrane prediction [Stieleria sedimenti]MCS7469285.1 transmembrane prediction [Stieleria sedimenti]
MTETSNRNEINKTDHVTSIWWIVVAPTVWAVHFLASYLTAAIFCAKVADSDRSAGEVQLAVMAYTVVAIVIIAGVGWAGHRRQRDGHGRSPHDEATAADLRRLIGLSTFLLSLLSAVATIFTALVFYFVGTCH